MCEKLESLKNYEVMGSKLVRKLGMSDRAVLEYFYSLEEFENSDVLETMASCARKMTKIFEANY